MSQSEPRGGFWTSERLRHELPTRRLVHPYSPNRVKYCAYELALGKEVFITSEGSLDGPRGKLFLEKGDQVVIPPGQFGLLLTAEEVTIPRDAIALISIKAGKKFGGLVNVSGFHVDPGFSGFLKFSVYNAGSRDVVLQCGEPLFPIWFVTLQENTADTYTGSHNGQSEITSSDVERLAGDVASPAVLKKEVDSLRSQVRILEGIAIAVVAGFLLTSKGCGACDIVGPSSPPTRQQLVQPAGAPNGDFH